MTKSRSNEAPQPRWRILTRSNLDQLKRRARELLNAFREGHEDARDLFATFHPGPPVPMRAQLADAQLVVARAHDYPSWPRFSRGVRLFNAICDDDPEAVLALIRSHPRLLHDRVNGSTSSWGPPLACAAQVGSPRVAEALLPIPGQDLGWALDRATLKGRTALARLLIDSGAEPAPDLAMGPAETLSVAGLEFVAELGLPLTDEQANPLGPVGVLLEGYLRDPPGKHACLEFFARRGIDFPDTPTVALHRGRIDLLEDHLARDPGLLERRFSHRELYPMELGCHEDESLALHGTPLAGTTLLHMAIDFDEWRIARWLMDHGADVDAAAVIGPDGFGGQTPLFHTVISQACRCGQQNDERWAQLLLEQGATPDARASIRKGMRFVADETVHEYRHVTPVEYGQRFHAPDWVNGPALRFIECWPG